MMQQPTRHLITQCGICLSVLCLPGVPVVTQLPSQSVFNFPETIVQSTEVPTRIRYGGTETRSGLILMQITVPNRDTTASAYGGQLRFYDVHIAKMFEVSHFLCQQSRTASGYEWIYEAGNGSISMGRFQISCRRAAEIANSYELGTPERTSIQRDTEGGSPEFDVYSIPILDITGNKIDRWLQFVENFRPISGRI